MIKRRILQFLMKVLLPLFKLKSLISQISGIVSFEEGKLKLMRYGSILCHMDFPIPVAVRFSADIEVFDFERPLIRGERSIIFIGLHKISTVLTKIHHTIKKETGEVLKRNPK